MKKSIIPVCLSLILSLSIATKLKNFTVYDPLLAVQQDNLVPLAIIGAGPAGYAAALYAGRAHMPALIIAGSEPGGQLMGSAKVENIPAVDAMPGYDIVEKLRIQAELFGARMLYDTVTDVDFFEWPFKIITEQGLKLNALTVIIATGASARLLGVSGEKTYFGRGVSTCAVCDAPLYRDADVAIVGGGDSAIEQAELLAAYARTVTLFVRSHHMRAAPHVRARLTTYDNISIVYNKHIIEICGNGQEITHVWLEDTQTKEQSLFPVQGLFLAIGHNPNAELFKRFLQLTSDGYIRLIHHQETSIRGIFAAGDVCDQDYRQAIVAMGDGSKAALDALKFLREDIGVNEKTVRSFNLYR